MVFVKTMFIQILRVASLDAEILCCKDKELQRNIRLLGLWLRMHIQISLNWKIMTLDFIHKDCHHSMSKDKKLQNSFLVVYKVKDEIKHDITRAGSKVEIFDHYYDNYDGVVSITWTDGIVDPRTYLNSKSTSSKKTPERKKRKREDKKDG